MAIPGCASSGSCTRPPSVDGLVNYMAYRTKPVRTEDPDSKPYEMILELQWPSPPKAKDPKTPNRNITALSPKPYKSHIFRNNSPTAETEQFRGQGRQSGFDVTWSGLVGRAPGIPIGSIVVPFVEKPHRSLIINPQKGTTMEPLGLLEFLRGFGVLRVWVSGQGFDAWVGFGDCVRSL